MAMKTFIDLEGLQYYHGKLKEIIPTISEYQGATSNANGVSGMVPAAVIADKDKYLKGDGTWGEVSAAKEIGYFAVEPTDSNVVDLDDESIIFYETVSMSDGNNSPYAISITGNAATATVANSASNLSTARSINISDADGSNVGTAISFDGSSNGTIKLPSTIKASLDGNAATATKVGHNLSIRVNHGQNEGSNLYTFNGQLDKSINIASGEGISVASSAGTITISAVPSIYQGATSSASGIAGLVPAATSAQKDNFLKGDGTWGEVSIPAVATSSELSNGSSTDSRIVTPKLIHDYVSNEVASGVAEIVNSAPAALDTLNELAAALGNDANFAATVSEQIGSKLDASSANYIKDISISGQTITYTKGDNTTGNLTTQDTTYTHPTTSGNKHIPSGGASGQFLKWSADGTATWAADNDTKNTTGSTDTSDKIFLVGATSQAENPQTYSHDTVYVDTDGCLYSNGVKVLTSHQDISGKADAMHSHAGTEVTLTGYAKASSVSAVAASDTINSAIGKLEKALDEKQPNLSAVTSTELSAGTDTDSKTVTAKTIHDYVAGEVASGVAGLVNSAPAALDTLNELAAALGNDPNFATTISANIGSKLDASSANYVKGLSISGKTITYTKGDNTTGTLTTQDTTYSNYQGATSSASGVAGLVPAATSAQKDNFLKGDGTWGEASTAKEIGYLSTEPNSSNVSALDNEAVIFYETDSILGENGSSAPYAISISGNAATATSATSASTLSTARSINVSDADGSNVGMAISFDGSSNGTIKLPSTIKANIVGNISGSSTSCTGNAAAADQVNHSISICIDGGQSEGSNQYVFNGSAAKEINFASGTGIQLTGSQGTVTVAGTPYQGASSSAAGISGLVPAASISAKDNFLRGDGTWAEIVQPAIVTSTELSVGTDTSVRTVSPKVIHDYVSDKIAGLVNSAPATLDTLNELASALGNDPNFATTVAASIGTKLDASSANYVKSLSKDGQNLICTKGNDTTQSVSLVLGVVKNIAIETSDVEMVDNNTAISTLIVQPTSEVLQKLSTYCNSSSSLSKQFIYDGTSFSGTDEVPSTWNSKVSVEINKRSTYWTIKAEPTVKSISDSQYNTPTAFEMPFGEHTIDVGLFDSPVFTRISYTLENDTIQFTHYDLYAKDLSTKQCVKLLVTNDNNSTNRLDLAYVGATSERSSKPGLVPSAFPSEKDSFLTGDGNWTTLDVITNAEVDALFEIAEEEEGE